MIELRHVNKRFENKCILDDLSISFDRGGIYVITGESGCGKTTLLRILMGLEAFEGEIVPHSAYTAAAVFQEDRLIEHLTALQNIRIAQDASVHPSPSLAPSRDALLEPEMLGLEMLGLEMLGLSGEAHTPVLRLSGGMKRRVAILRALESGADLLFFDEALKGLDEQNRDRTLRYIREKIKDKTVFWVTHHIEEIPALGACTHYRMEEGGLRLVRTANN